MSALTQLNKEVKAMEKRLQKYAKFEGLYLNENYMKLMRDIENIRSNIESGVDVKPQTISGLTRRVKNIKKTKLIELFDIYSPELDRSMNVVTSLKKPQVQFRVGEVVDILKEKATEVIEKIKSKYRKPPTEDFIPEPEPENEEIYYSDAIMTRIYEICSYHSVFAWASLMKNIDECIATKGYDETAQWFEETQQQYSFSDDISYEQAKEIDNELYKWSLQSQDLDYNKKMTELLERSKDFNYEA